MNSEKVSNSQMIPQNVTGIYFSRFALDLDEGGGSRRSLQIQEAFAPLGCHALSSAQGDGVAPEQWQQIDSGKFSMMRELLLMKGEYRLWIGKQRKRVCRLRTLAEHWQRILDECPGLRFAVIDDPIYFLPLIDALKQRRLPVIAVCHNLETLDGEQPNRHKRYALFQRELDVLAACDAVITISREDTVWFNNFQINTFYLPYYPIVPLQQRFLSLREERKTTAKRHLLLIGSALNSATRNGMRTVIEYWKTHQLAQSGDKLLIGGYGTDRFFQESAQENAVEYLGPLTQEVFDNLLLTVKGCLCFQERGTGALTRICEMLLAGVPVLANSQAARSYWGFDGVFEFADLDGLATAIQRVEQSPIVFPSPEPPNMNELHAMLNHLVKKQ